MSAPKITINHLYSESLNIYGDLGNIIALNHRAKQLNIESEVVRTELGETITPADIYFIGGGQDRDQIRVFEDLLQHREFIIQEVALGKIFLLICGGYQLFGREFLDATNNLITGLGILAITTKAPDATVKSRCIGNMITRMSPEFIAHWEIDTNFTDTLVGFENHGGQTTFLDDTVQGIGTVLAGYGNNAHEKIEGCSYQNIIGSYLHGSLLPKNPHLADAILRKALKNQGINLETRPQYSEIERNAHRYIFNILN